MADAAPLYETYMRAPLRFTRGEGVWLIAEDGERYLDFAAGVAVTSLGHGHPHLVAALKDQADKVWHLSNLYEVPGQESLGSRLTQATFADKVFFTNSGAEALECAIKTARRYHFAKGHPGKYHIITFEGAFHGRTIATIAATASTASGYPTLESRCRCRHMRYVASACGKGINSLRWPMRAIV